MLKAGFSKINITPPSGTPMTGFGHIDFEPDGAKGIRDDLFIRTSAIQS